MGVFPVPPAVRLPTQTTAASTPAAGKRRRSFSHRRSPLAAPVSLLDLGATLLALNGVEADFPGWPLVDAVRRQALAASPVLAHTTYLAEGEERTRDALVEGRWKLLRSGEERELYDLVADPGEQHDLLAAGGAGVAARAAELEATLERVLAERLAEAPALEGELAEPSAEDRERLEALGYF